MTGISDAAVHTGLVLSLLALSSLVVAVLLLLVKLRRDVQAIRRRCDFITGGRQAWP